MVTKYITDNLEMSSDDSNKEYADIKDLKRLIE